MVEGTLPVITGIQRDGIGIALRNVGLPIILAALDLVQQLHGHRVIRVSARAVAPDLLHRHLGAAVVLRGHGVTVEVDVILVVGSAVSSDFETGSIVHQQIARGRLDLLQVILRIRVQRPAVFALVARHANLAIGAGGEDDVIAGIVALVYAILGVPYRILVRIKQLELRALQPVGHVAGLVLHKVDYVDSRKA